MWGLRVCQPPPCGVCQLQPGLPHSTIPLGPQASALARVLSIQLPVSAPPTGLEECFFFNSLVVRLPYSSIFCQFWLFFVFKLLSFSWLCKEAQCVYLCLHLGWKPYFFFMTLEFCVMPLRDNFFNSLSGFFFLYFICVISYARIFDSSRIYFCL